MVILTHNAIVKPIKGSELEDPTLSIKHNGILKVVKAAFDSESEEGKLLMTRFGILKKIKGYNETA